MRRHNPSLRGAGVCRLSLLVLALLLASAIAATQASATKIEYVQTSDGLTLLVSGYPNEKNDISIDYDSGTQRYTITDAGVFANTAYSFFYPTFRCSPGHGSFSAVCDGSGVTRIEAQLGDGDDTLLVDSNVLIPATAFGGPGNDVLLGGGGNDVLIGWKGVDVIRGGQGDDVLWSDGANNPPENGGQLFGDEGNDLMLGTDAQETFNGGPGDDEVRAGGGDDVIDGGDGSDLLNGGDGKDKLFGGPGNDELGTVITGAPGNISLERGDDTMDGGPGDDLLRPGAGPPDPCPADVARDHPDDCSDNDILQGGDGFDRVWYERRTQPLRVSIDGVADDGQAGESDNVEPGVEKIIGGAGDDTLIGSPAEDSIDGAGGDDLIDGLAGSDSLEGGEGSDHIAGGSGNDTLSGSAGDDLLDGQDGADSLLGGDGADVLSGGNGNDRSSGGADSDTLEGGAANDNLDGGDGPDTLNGDDGNDSLRGSAGNDVLRGGAGSDEMFGGGGTDEAQYDLSARVTVRLDDIPNDGAAGERDNVRTDVERVVGGGDEDTFFGNTNNNTLDGAAGQDYLDGRPGPDHLLGGGARDVVRARDGSADTVDCGRSVDLAIVDPKDTVKNCEQTSDGVHDQPQQGADIIVDPVQGENTLQLPGMDRTVPLVTKEDRVEVPVGSAVDASDQGSVTVTSEAGGGESQAGQFEDGRFQIDQQRDDSVTNVRLLGGKQCRARGTGHARSSAQGGKSRRARQGRHGKGKIPPGAYGSSAAVTSRRGGRRKGPSGRSRFRMIGVFSSATGIGPASGAGSARRSRKSANSHTEWITTDRCDGTFTRVVSGEVRVRDFSRGRTISLGAGDSYLARPSG